MVFLRKQEKIGPLLWIGARNLLFFLLLFFFFSPLFDNSWTEKLFSSSTCYLGRHTKNWSICGSINMFHIGVVVASSSFAQQRNTTLFLKKPHVLTVLVPALLCLHRGQSSQSVCEREREREKFCFSSAMLFHLFSVSCLFFISLFSSLLPLFLSLNTSLYYNMLSYDEIEMEREILLVTRR